jgi:L-aspartate oxidase
LNGAARVKTLETDVVVVGSGIAGLTFALHMSEGARVLLVTKKERAASNTNHARGGIAAVLGPDDDAGLHVGDTLVAGAGLCHADVVDLVVRAGPARVRELMDWGAAFHADDGHLSLGREGGHSRRRIVHAGDRTGRAIESALLDTAARRGLVILEDHMAVDLDVTDGEAGGRRVRGLEVLEEATGARVRVWARIVLLATGGCGRVYRHTTNPAIATGDGVAMAYRAGAEVANMEFIQFHPTALYPTEDPAFLISEALRGEGAVLRRLDGTPFMDRQHALASLAPRDVVARALHRELVASGDPHAVLDVSALGEEVMRRRFPAALEGCHERGIDPLETGIPVVPAAHYVCGGVRTDSCGRTTLAGLMAAGEVACTGLHGANRLASNSLLEAVVVAHRSAEVARTDLEAGGRWRVGSEHEGPDVTGALRAEPVPGMAEPHPRAAGAAPRADGAASTPGDDALLARAERMRDLMWTHAGIVRRRDRLQEALARLEDDLARSPTASRLARPHLIEARNLLETAHLVVRSALARRESRGLHYLDEHPWRDNERCLHDTVLTVREGSGS